MLNVVIGIMIGWPILGLIAMYAYLIYRAIRVAKKIGTPEIIPDMMTEICSAIKPGNKIEGSLSTMPIEIEVLDNSGGKNEENNNRFVNIILWPKMILIFKAICDNYEKHKFDTSPN